MIEQDYKITRDDYIRFNMSHVKESKTTKLMITTLRFSVPLLLLAYSIYTKSLTNPVFMVIMTLFSIPWFIFSPRLIWIGMVKKMNDILDEGNIGELFSQRTISLTNETVVDKTEASSSSYDWSAFTALKVNESAIYLYTSPVQAIILPLRELKQKQKILKMIKEKTGLSDSNDRS